MTLPHTVPLNEIVSYLAEELAVTDFNDAAHNGLQVEGLSQVARLCTAVDASKQAVEKANEAGADALLVHHGLLWGRALPLTGRLGGVVRALYKNDMSLLAYHLPLDAHPTWGNNARLADIFGLEDARPFGRYKGRHIGYSGALALPTSAEDLRATVATHHGAHAQLHDFGPASVQHIAIVSGRACDEQLLTEAATQGVQLLLTGEMVHESWHVAKELGVSVIAAGHYATETHGVKAVGDHLAKHFEIDVAFIDIPTGL